MIWNIDSDEMRSYLNENSDKIGRASIDGMDTILSGLTFFVPTIFSDFSHLGSPLSTIILASCYFIAFLLVFLGICRLGKSIRARYGVDKIYKDIEGMNLTKHQFSLAVIKDTFNDFPDRFLVLYDERWECPLFPYYRTKGELQEDKDSIREHISNELKIDASKITVEKKGVATHRKTSQSSKTRKCYEHTIYLVSIPFRDEMKNESFTVGERTYSWMTLPAMLADDNIKAKNEDVIKTVDALIA